MNSAVQGVGGQVALASDATNRQEMFIGMIKLPNGRWYEVLYIPENRKPSSQVDAVKAKQTAILKHVATYFKCADHQTQFRDIEFREAVIRPSMLEFTLQGRPRYIDHGKHMIDLCECLCDLFGEVHGALGHEAIDPDSIGVDMGEDEKEGEYYL